MPYTPSLRAQRSNPESFRGGILDCFAALAMTEYEVSTSPFKYNCHSPRRRGIQYAATSRLTHNCLGVLDRPPSRAMTASL